MPRRIKCDNGATSGIEVFGYVEGVRASCNHDKHGINISHEIKIHKLFPHFAPQFLHQLLVRYLLTPWSPPYGKHSVVIFAAYLCSEESIENRQMVVWQYLRAVSDFMLHFKNSFQSGISFSLNPFHLYMVGDPEREQEFTQSSDQDSALINVVRDCFGHDPFFNLSLKILSLMKRNDVPFEIRKMIYDYVIYDAKLGNVRHIRTFGIWN